MLVDAQYDQDVFVNGLVTAANKMNSLNIKPESMTVPQTTFNHLKSTGTSLQGHSIAPRRVAKKSILIKISERWKIMSIVHLRKRIWVYCTLLTFLVVYISYAGCDMIEREGKAKIRVSEDKATVVFYKDVIGGGAKTWDIYFDSLLIGQLNWRSFFITELDPGEHYLSSALNTRTIIIRCKQHTVKTILQPGKIYFIENLVFTRTCMLFSPGDPEDFKQKCNSSFSNAHRMRMRYYVFQPDNFDEDDLIWDQDEYSENVSEFHESYRDNPETFRDMIEIKGYALGVQTKSNDFQR